MYSNILKIMSQVRSLMEKYTKQRIYYNFKKIKNMFVGIIIWMIEFNLN